MNKKNILVLCTDNSGGVETHGVNPRAIKIMAADGIDISRHTSNHINEYREPEFNDVITVCDNAKERCPFFPTKAQQFHQNFPDPAKATGYEAEIQQAFRSVRDQIKAYSGQFIQQHLS